MKKITELTEVRWRTVHYKDEYGNRERDTEEYKAKRPVKSVSAGPRFGHFFVDFIICQIIFYILQIAFLNLFKEYHDNYSLKTSLFLLNNIIVLIFYPSYYIISEHLWQKSPGKFLTKTIVIDEYGNKPELGTIILRSIIRIVPFEPFSSLSDDFSYAWHDKWSKTWVVTEVELAEIKRLQLEQSN